MMKRLPLSRKELCSHVGIFSDTGGGKSTFLKAYLREVERAGEMAVVWDPDREYAPLFRSVERGDWILDPTVEECPYWDIRREYRDEGEAHALSMSFLPDNPSVHDPFWNNSARGLLTILNTLHHPTTADLGLWMANDALIDARVVGTEYERILTYNTPGMRSSIISHLNLIAQPLRIMPTHPAGRRTFAVRDYCATRNSWIFVSSTPSYSAILNPLHTFFLSSLIQRVIAMGPRPDLPRIHFIFEEASSITIQDFHLGLVRLRKTGNPLVFAIQNFADLKKAYGENAETIFSQPYTKIYFRLSSDETAKKIEGTIGQKTIKKMRDTYQAPRWGVGVTRRSYTYQNEVEPVVPAHWLQNLPDREGFATKPGKICRFRLPILTLPTREPAIVDRPIPPLLRVLPPQVPAPARPRSAAGTTAVLPGAGVL